MTSKVEICNVALSRLGVSKGISSLDEDSIEASQLSLVYDMALRRTLSDFPWLFARKSVSLPLLSATSPEWDYVYRYPSDCLRALYLLPEGGTGDGWDASLSLGDVPVMTSGRRRIRFRIGSDDVGRVILTNEESAILVYTADISDPLQFPYLFVDALAWRLAFEVGMALTAEPGLQDRAEQKYRQVMGEAMEHSFNESEEGREPDSEFMRTRV